MTKAVALKELWSQRNGKKEKCLPLVVQFDCIQTQTSFGLKVDGVRQWSTG